MSSEFHYSFILLALTSACASQSEKEREFIELPAVSAPSDNKPSKITSKRSSDTPPGVDPRETPTRNYSYGPGDAQGAANGKMVNPDINRNYPTNPQNSKSYTWSTSSQSSSSSEKE